MEFSRSLASEGIEWLDQMAQPNRWNLTDEDVARLIGGLPASAYRKLKCKVSTGHKIELTDDVIERISLLQEISKGLQGIAPHERNDLGYAWFNKPNTGAPFNGLSIKEFLLRADTIEPFYNARDYLMAHS